MAVRIKGLNSAFNDVRAQLQAGISPEQEEQFRDHVLALITQVEEICATHGTTPASLPSPSRKAYTFLKNLDTRHLPRPTINSGGIPHPSYTVTLLCRCLCHKLPDGTGIQEILVEF